MPTSPSRRTSQRAIVMPLVCEARQRRVGQRHGQRNASAAPLLPHRGPPRAPRVPPVWHPVRGAPGDPRHGRRLGQASPTDDSTCPLSLGGGGGRRSSASGPRPWTPDGGSRIGSEAPAAVHPDLARGPSMTRPPRQGSGRPRVTAPAAVARTRSMPRRQALRRRRQPVYDAIRVPRRGAVRSRSKEMGRHAIDPREPERPVDDRVRRH